MNEEALEKSFYFDYSPVLVKRRHIITIRSFKDRIKFKDTLLYGYSFDLAKNR